MYQIPVYGRITVQSSRKEVFCGKGVLRNFTKFAGKHLYQSLFFNKVAGLGLFFNKVAGLRPATLLKKSLWHRCFPVNFVKFLRAPFLIEHSDGCFWTVTSRKLRVALIYRKILRSSSRISPGIFMVNESLTSLQ